jgi:hypothetical protein
MHAGAPPKRNMRLRLRDEPGLDRQQYHLPTGNVSNRNHITKREKLEVLDILGRLVISCTARHFAVGIEVRRDNRFSNFIEWQCVAFNHLYTGCPSWLSKLCVVAVHTTVRLPPLEEAENNLQFGDLSHQ